MCFGSKYLTFFFRDDFESSKCCLDIWLSSMLDCIHVCIFLFFEKLFLSNLDSFLIPLDSWVIYRASWVSFINSCYWDFDLSRFLRIRLDRCLTASRSIKEISICLIASWSIEVTLLWTPFDSSIWLFLILDTSRYLPIHRATYLSIYRVCTFSFISHRSFSTESLSFLSQTLLTHTLHLPHLDFGLY